MTSIPSSRLVDFFTHDHASPLDPYIKWVRNPLAILILAAVAAVLCGLYLHPRALVLAAGLAAVATLGAAWPWLSLRGLAGSMSFSASRAREGEPVVVRLSVRNRMPWGAWCLGVRGHSGPGVGLGYASGWGVAEERWTWTPDRRGIFPTGAPEVVTSFPFGLRESSRRIAVPAPLIVWPRTFPVGPVPEAAGGREGEGPAARDKAGSAGDPIGVRPYRRGDSLRRVHWPQSARHGQLIVCELESRAIPRVQIVVDVDPGSHAGDAAGGSWEWSLRVAASFAEDWIGQGAVVEVVAGRRSISPTDRAVTGRRARVLDAFAGLEPDASSPLGAVLDGPLCRRLDGFRVVVATDLAVAGLGGRAARGAAERFVVLVASAFDAGASRAEPAPAAIRPWMLLDDPGSVARSVRQGWKEVGLDR